MSTLFPTRMLRRRHRVLVEADERRTAEARVALLELGGYDAVWCPGPPNGRASACPLVGGHGCSMASWADVVLCCFGVEKDWTRRILHAMADEHPDKPVVVETSDHSAEVWAPMLEGWQVLSRPSSAHHLLWAVAAALGEDTAHGLPD